MEGILSLKPEDEEKLHPNAIRWFNARVSEIKYEVPLEELDDYDLNTFLSNHEKHEFNRYKDEITRGLVTCLKKQAASSDLMANATIELSLIQFQVNSLLPISSICTLLKTVYQRKVAKAKQELIERTLAEKRIREQMEAEQRRKAEADRRRTAYEAVNPPLDDAKKYLNKEEYDEFLQATGEAIEVYLEKGNEHLHNIRTYNYCRYLEMINDRKKIEQLKIAAKLQAREYNQYLNREIARLKTLLCPDRKDHDRYFKEQINDSRYTGQNFAYFLSNKEAQSFNKAISDISRKKLEEIVSGDFRQFIDIKCQRSFFLLPSTEYSFDEVPCLDFMFDIFTVIETALWLTPGAKRNLVDMFLDLPWREEQCYSVLLRQPEFLGYYYLAFTLGKIGGYVFGTRIPLVLLKWLLNDQKKPNGLTITAAVDRSTTYKFRITKIPLLYQMILPVI